MPSAPTIEIPDMVKFQSGIQDAVLNAMKAAQAKHVGPQQMLQLIAQEVVHHVLTSSINLEDAKCWYSELEEPEDKCGCDRCPS